MSKKALNRGQGRRPSNSRSACCNTRPDKQECCAERTLDKLAGWAVGCLAHLTRDIMRELHPEDERSYVRHLEHLVRHLERWERGLRLFGENACKRTRFLQKQRRQGRLCSGLTAGATKVMKQKFEGAKSSRRLKRFAVRSLSRAAKTLSA